MKKGSYIKRDKLFTAFHQEKVIAAINYDDSEKVGLVEKTFILASVLKIYQRPWLELKVISHVPSFFRSFPNLLFYT